MTSSVCRHLVGAVEQADQAEAGGQQQVQVLADVGLGMVSPAGGPAGRWRCGRRVGHRAPGREVLRQRADLHAAVGHGAAAAAGGQQRQRRSAAKTEGATEDSESFMVMASRG